MNRRWMSRWGRRHAAAEPAGLRRALADVEAFGSVVLGMPLRPYQAEVARAVLASIAEGRGDSLTVLMPRQSGKNQLSAHLEAYLLTRRQRRGGSLVKCAPTYRPQVLVSIARLLQGARQPADGRAVAPARRPHRRAGAGQHRVLLGRAGRQRRRRHRQPAAGVRRGPGRPARQVGEGFPADGRHRQRDERALRHALDGRHAAGAADRAEPRGRGAGRRPPALPGRLGGGGAGEPDLRPARPGRDRAPRRAPPDRPDPVPAADRGRRRALPRRRPGRAAAGHAPAGGRPVGAPDRAGRVRGRHRRGRRGRGGPLRRGGPRQPAPRLDGPDDRLRRPGPGRRRGCWSRASRWSGSTPGAATATASCTPRSWRWSASAGAAARWWWTRPGSAAGWRRSWARRSARAWWCRSATRRPARASSPTTSWRP